MGSDPEGELASSAGVLVDDLEAYVKLQAEELKDTFELIFQLNQTALGRYGEMLQEASGLKAKATILQEQELGVGVFLANLAVLEGDVRRLEETCGQLESYCAVLEAKVDPTRRPGQ